MGGNPLGFRLELHGSWLEAKSEAISIPTQLQGCVKPLVYQQGAIQGPCWEQAISRPKPSPQRSRALQARGSKREAKGTEGPNWKGCVQKWVFF